MNLKELSKKVLENDIELIKGKEKITTDELMLLPKISIDGCELLNNNDGDYSVFTFKEDSKKFFFGGKVLTELVKEWIKFLGGSIDDVNELLTKEPIPVVMSMRRTKDGKKNYVNIEILD